VPPRYPFSAIVGQEEMKTALLIAAVEPSIGGVLILGHRGTAKSTAVRALAGVLPAQMVTGGCRYGCDPAANGARCDDCHAREARGERAPRLRAEVPVIDLPLGATRTGSSARWTWSARSATARSRTSPGCSRARTAASCTSTR
jgi:magnesium chelatase subunit I